MIMGPDGTRNEDCWRRPEVIFRQTDFLDLKEDTQSYTDGKRIS
jgi:hypothetical protein